MNTFCKMEFVKDHLGQEILLKDGEFQVMMEWEKPYMQACIESLEPTGDVLEIGFGCGYSATHIQTFKPRSHTIIEYHPEVIKKAKEWARDFPNVTIIEDTWQKALPKLTEFDQVFFDDYPLESCSEQKRVFKEKEEASWIVRQGEKLLSKIHKKFSFLQNIMYEDKDIEYFFNHLKSKSPYQKEHFLPFFDKLKQGLQITECQYQAVIDRLIKESLIDEKTLTDFREKQKKPFVAIEEKRGDRLFEFLEPCLKQHLKIGGRFSCYLEESHSRYEDSIFVDKVILHPSLDFKEKWVEVAPPQHCKYFKHQQALVIVITKLASM